MSTTLFAEKLTLNEPEIKMNIKKMIVSGMLSASFFVSLACGQKAAGESKANLNSMSKKEYSSFVREIFTAHQKDPQAVGEKARDIIIGMAGLENRPSSHPIFEIDVNFTTNAMLILVANANKIKRSDAFINEFKKQMASTRPKIKTDEQKIYFDVFTELLLKEQANIKS